MVVSIDFNNIYFLTHLNYVFYAVFMCIKCAQNIWAVIKDMQQQNFSKRK